MGRWEIRGLETGVGRECCICRGGGADCTVKAYMSEESEEGVTVLQQGGSSKSESCQELRIWRGKVVSTLDGLIWSRCSIALTCPARSHIQCTHRARKDGTRVRMNVTAHQEKEKNEQTKKGRRKKRKNKQPILKKL